MACRIAAVPSSARRSLRRPRTHDHDASEGLHTGMQQDCLHRLSSVLHGLGYGIDPSTKGLSVLKALHHITVRIRPEEHVKDVKPFRLWQARELDLLLRLSAEKAWPEMIYGAGMMGY